MKKTYLTVAAALATAALASTGALAQATHPSENYPGKGGAQDTTNGAANSPEAVNPTTGQQQSGQSSQGGAKHTTTEGIHHAQR